MPQEALTAAGYTLTKHSAAAAAEGPKSQQRKRGRRTKVNSVEMVSLVRRVLAPHLQDTERVAVVGRGRNKKMVVAHHLRKKRYRVFLEEPELHESMSWSTFHSIMKRHFPHVKNPTERIQSCPLGNCAPNDNFTNAQLPFAGPCGWKSRPVMSAKGCPFLEGHGACSKRKEPKQHARIVLASSFAVQVGQAG